MNNLSQLECEKDFDWNGREISHLVELNWYRAHAKKYGEQLIENNQSWEDYKEYKSFQTI